MGVLVALAGTALYGTTNVLVRRGSRHGLVGDGYLLTVLFNALTFGVALAWLAAAGQLPPLNVAGLLAFAGAGLTTTFLGRRLQYAALAIIGPARAIPFKVTSPIFTVLLAHLFLGETLSAGLVLGVAAVATGLWLLSRERVDEAVRQTAAAGAQAEGLGEKAADQPRWLWTDPAFRKGAALALLSGASFGVGHFLRKLGVLEIPSEFAGVAVGSWVALGAGWLARMVEGPRTPAPSAARPGWLPWEFWMAGTFTTLAVFLQFVAVRLMPVSTVSVIFASEPLMSIAAARFLLHDEVLTRRAIVSAALVFGGIAVVIAA